MIVAAAFILQPQQQRIFNVVQTWEMEKTYKRYRNETISKIGL